MKPAHLLHSAFICSSSPFTRRLKSRHPLLPVVEQFISLSDNNNILRHTGRIPMEFGVAGQPYKTPHFHPRHRHSFLGMTLPRTAWVRLNRLCTGVGRFRSCLYKWVLVSSAACECFAEEQTVDHVVFQCPIHRLPHGLHGLTLLDAETMEWLLNTCPTYSVAKQWFEELAHKMKKMCVPCLHEICLDLVCCVWV